MGSSPMAPTMKMSDVYNAPKYAGVFVLRNDVNGKCYVGRATKLRKALINFFGDLPSFLEGEDLGNFSLEFPVTWHNALGQRTQYEMGIWYDKYVEMYNSKAPNGYNE